MGWGYAGNRHRLSKYTRGRVSSTAFVVSVVVAFAPPVMTMSACLTSTVVFWVSVGPEEERKVYCFVFFDGVVSRWRAPRKWMNGRFKRSNENLVGRFDQTADSLIPSTSSCPFLNVRWHPCRSSGYTARRDGSMVTVSWRRRSDKATDGATEETNPRLLPRHRCRWIRYVTRGGLSLSDQFT